MNKSQIFKAAHKLAKSVHVAGDCYRVTFSAALKIVIAESKATVLNVETFMDALIFEANVAIRSLCLCTVGVWQLILTQRGMVLEKNQL